MESKPTPLPGSSPDEMFPALTAQQREYWRMADQERSGVARLSLNPTRKELSSLWVVAGGLELLLLSDNKEEVIALCGPGVFTGELNVLSGRRGLVQIRASEPSDLIEIEREPLQGLVQTIVNSATSSCALLSYEDWN